MTTPDLPTAGRRDTRPRDDRPLPRLPRRRRPGRHPRRPRSRDDRAPIARRPLPAPLPRVARRDGPPVTPTERGEQTAREAIEKALLELDELVDELERKNDPTRVADLNFARAQTARSRSPEATSSPSPPHRFRPRRYRRGRRGSRATRTVKARTSRSSSLTSTRSATPTPNLRAIRRRNAATSSSSSSTTRSRAR
jgi:hypothetical protein